MDSATGTSVPTRHAGPERPGSAPSRAATDHASWWLRALSHLPFAALYALSGVLTVLLRDAVRYRVEVVRANLSGCFPDVPEALRRAMLKGYYRQLTQVLVEVIKLATVPGEQLLSRVQLSNLQRVTAETAQGRSVLLLAAHHCNWEWALQVLALRLGVPIDAGYKPLHGAHADRQLRALRSRFGVRLVTAKDLPRELARRRHEVHALALMADQMPSSSHTRHWLRFLGRDTAFYPGPGMLARRTGYAAFFVSMRRTDRGRYEMDFHPISAARERLEPEQFTERYARLVEQQIRAHPTDWTWSHRRWKPA